jgi:GT2 family glycosyltransferase
VHNAAKTIAAQLAALARQRCEFEFATVISLNRCTDASRQIVEEFSDQLRLRVVVAEDRPGAAFARNCGVRCTDADFILHCDADDVLSDAWVATMVRALGQSDVVGGQLRVPEPRDRWWFLNAGLYEQAGLPQSRGVRFTPSCSLGYRRIVFEELGGFDERLGLFGSEDVAFCHLAQRLGFTIGYAEGASIDYFPRPDRASALKQRFSYGRTETWYRALYTPYELRSPSREIAYSLASVLRSGAQSLSRANDRRQHQVAAWTRAGRLRGQIEVVRSRQWPSRSQLGRPGLERTLALSLPEIDGMLITRGRGAASPSPTDVELTEAYLLCRSLLPADGAFIDVAAGNGELSMMIAAGSDAPDYVIGVEEDPLLLEAARANLERLGVVLRRRGRNPPTTLMSQRLDVAYDLVRSKLSLGNTLEYSRAMHSKLAGQQRNSNRIKVTLIENFEITQYLSALARHRFLYFVTGKISHAIETNYKLPPATVNRLRKDGLVVALQSVN